jgi:hypothetical protein
LNKKLFWNGSFALLHSQAPPLIIAIIINISDLTYDLPIKYASSVISLVLLVTISIAIGIEIYVIRTKIGRYEQEEFKNRYNVIFEGLNNHKFIGRYWNPLLLIRWLLTIIILVFLKETCVAQILALLVISIIFQILLAIENPMDEKSDRILSWIIEASVSIYLYVLLSLTEVMGENTYRDEIGWLLVLLTGSIVAINVLVFIWRSIGKVVAYVKHKFPHLLNMKARKT